MTDTRILIAIEAVDNGFIVRQDGSHEGYLPARTMGAADHTEAMVDAMKMFTDWLNQWERNSS